MPTQPVAVRGVVQHYAWGDTTFIPELLGETADGQPWAELWLGTHPSGPATIDDGRPLLELTGDLPYLLKVIAAAQPLSLQVHPTTSQAIDGFARGVYPDDRAKPELLCALTRFDALCGIRPVGATLTLLGALGADGLAHTTALRRRRRHDRGDLPGSDRSSSDDRRLRAQQPTRSRTRHHARHPLSRRSEHDRHPAAQPRHVAARGGAAPHCRQPPRLPERRRCRADGLPATTSSEAVSPSSTSTSTSCSASSTRRRSHSRSWSTPGGPGGTRCPKPVARSCVWNPAAPTRRPVTN